jgi:hypothetical protein
MDEKRFFHPNPHLVRLPLFPQSHKEINDAIEIYPICSPHWRGLSSSPLNVIIVVFALWKIHHFILFVTSIDRRLLIAIYTHIEQRH